MCTCQFFCLKKKMLLSWFSFISPRHSTWPKLECAQFVLHYYKHKVCKVEQGSLEVSCDSRSLSTSSPQLSPHPHPSQSCPWSGRISSSWIVFWSVVWLRWTWGANVVAQGHSGYDHKSQNPHQHERHSDGDDGRHHCVVALIWTEHPAQATSHPVRRSAYIHHSGRGDPLLHCTQLEVPAWCRLSVLTLGRQTDDIRPGRAVGRRVLQHQLTLAALKADGQRPLHIWREFADDVPIISQTGQVPAMRELSHLSAHGAGQGLELRWGDVDASQALQTEGVPACQQLWGLENIIVSAETHSALCVLHVIFRGFRPSPIALSAAAPAALLAPSTMPPFSMVPVWLSPPPSFRPLRVRTPRSPHSWWFLFFPVLLLAVPVILPEFGFDVRGLGLPDSMALFGPAVSLPTITHAGVMSEVKCRLEFDSYQFPNSCCGKLNLRWVYWLPKTSRAGSKPQEFTCSVTTAVSQWWSKSA